MLNTHQKTRPSASMTVAVIALTLALGGSAIAGTSAAKKSLSKAAVTKIAQKQANAAIDSRASSLNVSSAKTATSAQSATTATSADTAKSAATAQNATNAQNAVNAQNAAAVGGIKLAEINYSAATQSAPVTIFQANGLKLEAECLSSTEVHVTAATSKADASIYAMHTTTDFDTDNTTTSDSESGGFDLPDEFNVLTTSDDGLIDSGLTTFEYDAPDGTSITGTFSTDEDTTNPASCEVHGHVTVS